MILIHCFYVSTCVIPSNPILQTQSLFYCIHYWLLNNTCKLWYYIYILRYTFAWLLYLLFFSFFIDLWTVLDIRNMWRELWAFHHWNDSRNQIWSKCHCQRFYNNKYTKCKLNYQIKQVVPSWFYSRIQSSE